MIIFLSVLSKGFHLLQDTLEHIMPLRNSTECLLLQQDLGNHIAKPVIPSQKGLISFSFCTLWTPHMLSILCVLCQAWALGAAPSHSIFL